MTQLVDTPPQREIAALTVAAATIGGIGELALRLIARTSRDTPVFIDPQAVWMAPLVNVVIIGAVLAIVNLVTSRIASSKARFAVWAFAIALAVAGPLLLVPRLHVLAVLLLSTGVGMQAARLAARYSHRAPRALRAVLASGVLIAVAGGLAVLGARAWRERRALRAANGEGSAPNVILLVLDTVRAIELQSYGFGRRTSPFLQRLSATGVVFDRAVATAPWTLPTHSTLFTGRYPHELSSGWSTPLDTRFPTLAERFAAHGYATAGFAANPRYGSYEFGLARGFGAYRDYATSLSQIAGASMLSRLIVGQINRRLDTDFSPGRKNAGAVSHEFLQWHDRARGRPFFAFLNFFDAHEPYVAEPPYDLMFADSSPPLRRIEVGLKYSARDAERLRNAYDGTIASLDAALDSMFAELERRGALRNTLVVITSDHGEEFLEHGHLSHGNGLHFPALHVPLMFVQRGRIPAGARVASPVTLRDVPATILAQAGLEGDGQIPGQSLAPLWRESSGGSTSSPILSELFFVANQPDWYPVAHGDLKSIVVGRYHYIRGPKEREALYDIVSDPLESSDRLHDPAAAVALDSARAALSRIPWQDRGGR